MTEVADIRNKAQDPMVLNSGARSDIVIKFLDDLKAQLSKVEQAKMKFSSWDELFKSGGGSEKPSTPDQPASAKPGAPPAAVSSADAKTVELEETKTEVELKRTLWKSLKDWEIITE